MAKEVILCFLLLIATVACLQVDAPGRQVLRVGRRGFLTCAPRLGSTWERPRIRWLDNSFQNIVDGYNYIAVDGGLIIRRVRWDVPMLLICEVSIPGMNYLRHYFIDVVIQ